MINGEASMKQNIVYVGLDVDDVQYHGSMLANIKPNIEPNRILNDLGRKSITLINSY